MKFSAVFSEQDIRAEMTKMFANLLERIREQGFAVARLEDYIQPPAR